MNKRCELIRNNIRKSKILNDDLKNHLLQSSFIKTPNHIKHLMSEYGFDQKKVLDIGCGYGQSLLYWGSQSIGLDVKSDCAEFLKEQGYGVKEVNIEDKWNITDKFEAIFSSNLIEHLVAPHAFLMRCNKLLAKEGVFALLHPVIPPVISKPLVRAYFKYSGWLASEHVNFYTSETIKLTLERAGFEIIEQFNPGINLQIKKVPLLNDLITSYGSEVITICKVNKKYHYRSVRSELFDPEWLQI